MGYYTGEISQIYRILSSFEDEHKITTAIIWAKSNIHHRRGKPILHRLKELGFIESNPIQNLAKGYSKRTVYWNITDSGINYRSLLEIYVKA